MRSIEVCHGSSQVQNRRLADSRDDVTNLRFCPLEPAHVLQRNMTSDHRELVENLEFGVALVACVAAAETNALAENLRAHTHVLRCLHKCFSVDFSELR